jgi:hypothetical protein
MLEQINKAEQQALVILARYVDTADTLATYETAELLADNGAFDHINCTGLIDCALYADTDHDLDDPTEFTRAAIIGIMRERYTD